MSACFRGGFSPYTSTSGCKITTFCSDGLLFLLLFLQNVFFFCVFCNKKVNFDNHVLQNLCGFFPVSRCWRHQLMAFSCSRILVILCSRALAFLHLGKFESIIVITGEGTYNYSEADDAQDELYNGPDELQYLLDDPPNGLEGPEEYVANNTKGFL